MRILRRILGKRGSVVAKTETVSPASPEWEHDGLVAEPHRPDATGPNVGLAIGIALFALVGLLIGAGLLGTEFASSPQTSMTTTTVAPTTSSTTLDPNNPAPPTTGVLGPGLRIINVLPAPVLGVESGLVTVSTDFDGRLVVVDLDTGAMTRTPIRTGRFVEFDSRILVQNGCGGWQELDFANFALGPEVIECGSYRPLGQLGAKTRAFTAPNDPSFLVIDGLGGLRRVTLPQFDVDGLADMGGFVALQLSDLGVTFDPETLEVSPDGAARLLAVADHDLLWTDCELGTSCGLWLWSTRDFGSTRLPIDPNVRELPVRLASAGFPTRQGEAARAVFFDDEQNVLHILDLSTGQMAIVDNPGLRYSRASWSPDRHWLVDTTGRTVTALDVRDGSVVEFDQVPGDVSPGWVAIVENPG